MKINHVISEHKKGIKAVKYNKKPQDPATAHAKAKEKLAPIKPMEGYNINGVDAQHERELKAHHKAELKKKADAGDENAKKRLQALHDKEQARRDEFDARMERESIEQGVAEAFQNDESNLWYIYHNGRLKQRMIHNDEERAAHNHGYRDSIEGALRTHNIIRSKFDSSKFVQKVGDKWVPVNPFGSADDVEEAQGDPIGTVQSATPDGKVAIKTDTGVVTTDKSALMPGATPQDPLQMKPDAAGGGLTPGAKVVSTAEDILPPPADSQSPIHGGTVHGDEGHGNDDHNEIIQLLKRLAQRDGIEEEAPPAPAATTPPAADIDPGERILDVQTTPEIDAYIEANTVRDADGDVDFAGSLGKMMSGASEKMDIKGLQDAVVQMEAKFKAFPSSPEFKAMSPQEQQEWTQAAPEGLKVMQDVAAQLVKMAQGFEQGAKQLTDFSKTADYVNPMKGVKSLPPQQATPKPAVTEDNQLLQKMLTIAGLR